MNLTQLPFFKQFSEPVRQALFEAGKVRAFHPGDLIFQSGDKNTDFYMLVAGRIQIYKLSKGGQKRILRTVQPGDTFALVSLFDDKPMFISAEVLGEEAKVFVIPHEQFLELLQQYYEIARFVIDGFVRRIRRYGEAVTNMAVYYIDQRFISYLFELSEHQQSDHIRLPDSVKTIAEQFGTVREVLSREISKMVKKGWIKKSGQVVQILNRKGMEGRLGEA